MKKYLMSGVAAIAFLAAFTSCSKSADLYDQGAVDAKNKQEQEQKEQKKAEDVNLAYNNAFVKAFGQPAANQDWGFGSRKLPASFGNSTRAAQTNSNQWGTHDDNDKYLDWPLPEAISSQELADVLEVFNQKGKTEYEPLVHWENFWVQQVYTGPNGSKMNELATTVNYVIKTEVICWWPYEAKVTRENVDPFDDIINNYNEGDYKGSDISTYNSSKCMLMWNSATDDFSFKTSQGGGQRWYKHWRMEKINGNYYVGFDHESAKQGSDANNNELDVRDYIYNDWIVKIIPGNGETTPNPTRYKVRIICEDLMATGGSDFDFNDVVFDADYVEGENKTYITVKAAGGTIPLYIEGQEVHQLFAQQYPNAGIVIPNGEVRGTMINTKANGGVEVGDVTLVLNEIKAPWDIAITINDGGTTIPLKAEVGQPTAKIAVDPSFQWLNERDDIRTSCPNFASYVKDTTVNWY